MKARTSNSSDARSWWAFVLLVVGFVPFFRDKEKRDIDLPIRFKGTDRCFSPSLLAPSTTDNQPTT